MHCKSNKSQDMLQATNPAILQLEPRAGGLVQLEGKGGSCKCKSKKRFFFFLIKKKHFMSIKKYIYLFIAVFHLLEMLTVVRRE